MGYSRWMLADLQVHTPIDKHQKYGEVGGPSPNKKFAEELIKRHADAGVRIVAVTDHNSVDWWAVLHEAGAEHGVFVFPGLEVNINKCHLLAIFERNEAGCDLAKQFLASRFAPGAEIIDQDRNPAPVPKGNVLEVAEAAVKHQGLVLAPHSTLKKMGLFASNVCNVSADVARSGLVAGFDVVGNKGADVLKNPRSEFGDVRPAWFSSGDVRSFDAIGHRACYLKVGDPPTLESLRQAFLMPGTRIRLSEGMRADWGATKHVSFLEGPAPTTSWIESVAIDGGFHEGLKVEFGPGLNAIIGGKGTGKSTLIEIIRFLLDQPAPESGDGSRKENFPNNADGQLRYRASDGELYAVEKSGGSGRAQLLADGEPLDFEASRRVDVQIFGQRQLEKLPADTAALREFVLTRKSSELREAEEALSAAAKTARELAEQIDGLDDEVGKHSEATEELKDVSERLKRLTTRAAQKQIQESNELVAQDAAMTELLQWPEEVVEAVQGLLDAIAEPPPLPSGANHPSGLADTRKARADAIRAAARTAMEEAKLLEEEFQQAGEAWDEAIETKRQEVDALLASAGLKKASELAKLQAEKARLEKSIEISAKKLATRKDLIPKREAAVGELDKARREISRLTEDAVKELNAETGPRVQLIYRGLANATVLLDFLGDRVTHRKVTDAQASRLRDLDGRRLAAAALAGSTELGKLNLTDTLRAALENCEKSVLRELEEVEMSDELHVQVDTAETGQAHWTDVTDASPGQRATALLELALIAGDAPLIIDQPEDDLDNRFIYDEVVQKMAEVANRRQLIVATHNANIPVLGDAELILALEASSDQSRELANGGLDERKVAETARKILEGGEEAFAARAQRYAPPA